MDRGTWLATVHGLQKNKKKNLVTKQQQQSQTDTEWENQTSGL